MSDKYGWPTTRRYPRTTKEAFPNDVENAQWWFPPETRTVDKFAIAIGVIVWIAIGIYFWRTT